MLKPLRRAAATTASAALLALPLAAVASSADAAPKARSYTNCTELNKVYKHGVARTLPKLDRKGRVVKKNGKVVYVKAVDKVRGKTKPVITFTTDSKTYDYNNGKDSKAFKDGVQPRDYQGEKDLDRDNDGVACEKR